MTSKSSASGPHATVPKTAPNQPRFLALWFPFLASDRVRRANGSSLSPEGSLAFVEKQKGAARLTALSREAIENGLAVGTSLATARAITPDLVVRDHNTMADADLLDRIADDCMRFTPMVAVEQPDGIMLDITGVAHLAGNEGQLAREVESWFQARRITACLAFGSSAEAAHALVRFHRGKVIDEIATIRALPVTALKLDPESDLGLRRAGLTTVGDVMDRPRKVIAARFGSAIVYHLERLIGMSTRPLDLRVPVLLHIFHRRFADPIASKDYAMEVLRGLLGEAKRSLEEQDLGGRAFEARFYRVDGLVQHLHVETGRPTRDTRAIARLFDERLDSLADPLDPGFGFDEISLKVLQTELLKSDQGDIEKETIGGSPLGEVLDVLAIRLGRNRLLRFRPYDTHIPEKGQVAVPATDAPQAFTWPRARLGEPPARPLQLFDPPQRIAVIAEIPDGPPRRFRWRGELRNIVRQEGPERIAPEWWNSFRDPLGRDRFTRDYYRIEDATGRRYWVFRDGLYGREAVDPDWYLHGLFA